jgi:predicted transcriptional regulator
VERGKVEAMTREERVLEDLLFHVRNSETVADVLTEKGRAMMEAYYTINSLLLEKEMRHRDLESA